MFFSNSYLLRRSFKLNKTCANKMIFWYRRNQTPCKEGRLGKTSSFFFVLSLSLSLSLLIIWRKKSKLDWLSCPLFSQELCFESNYFLEEIFLCQVLRNGPSNEFQRKKKKHVGNWPLVSRTILNFHAQNLNEISYGFLFF